MAFRSRLRVRERALALLPLCLCLCQLVASHSWVGCTDYRGPVDFYDESKCHGYPRLYEVKRGATALTPLSTGYQLGADTGYNFRASESQPCPWPVTNPIDSSYTTNYPKATYEQGGLYCLAWPTKNHVAAPCTNQYIPDTALQLGRSNINPTPATEATQAEFSSHPVLTYFGTHAQGVIDCLGFQRSPQFCLNTDRALATGCFRVPADLAVGVYSYQWHWEFNPGEVYTSCWDAKVVAPGTGTGVGSLQYDPDTMTDTLGSAGTTCRTKWATVSNNPPPVTPPPVTPPPPAIGGCGAGEFDCDDGTCVAGFAVCDGTEDCSDGTDEMDCGDGDIDVIDCSPLSSQSTCSATDDCAWCVDGGVCIATGQTCPCTNNQQDEGELGPDCGGTCAQDCPVAGCDAGKFDCGDGMTCVAGFVVCDGTADCSGGTDEMDCGDGDIDDGDGDEYGDISSAGAATPACFLLAILAFIRA